MRSRRGQAAAEAIAVVGAVGALVAALASGGALAWLPSAAARAFDGDPTPPGAAVAFLDRAVARRPGDAPPPLGDALLRLAAAVGTERAQALARERLLRAYPDGPGRRREALADPSWALQRPALDGVGPPGDGVWAEVEPRAPATVRIATADDERRWAASRRPSTAQRIVDAGTAAAIGAAAAVSAEASLVATLLGAGAAAAESAPSGIPPGSRADDALLCRFTWRRTTAAPGWAADHPVDAGRLAIGQRVPVVELTVVRAGRAIAQVAVRSDATAC